MLTFISTRVRFFQVLLVLDPAHWAGAAGKSWPHRQVEHGAGSSRWRAARQAGGWGGQDNLSDVLRAAITALRPSESVSYELEPFCRGPRRHVCNCSAPTTTLWWEQASKNAICLQHVVGLEHRRGRSFDFVLKLRSDMQLAASGVSAAGTRAGTEPTRPSLKPLVHMLFDRQPPHNHTPAMCSNLPCHGDTRSSSQDGARVSVGVGQARGVGVAR